MVGRGPSGVVGRDAQGAAAVASRFADDGTIPAHRGPGTLLGVCYCPLVPGSRRRRAPKTADDRRGTRTDVWRPCERARRGPGRYEGAPPGPETRRLDLRGEGVCSSRPAHSTAFDCYVRTDGETGHSYRRATRLRSHTVPVSHSTSSSGAGRPLTGAPSRRRRPASQSLTASRGSSSLVDGRSGASRRLPERVHAEDGSRDSRVLRPPTRRRGRNCG